MKSISSMIEYALKNKATDIHLLPGEIPHVRIAGSLQKIQGGSPIERESMSEILQNLTKEPQKEQLNKTKYSTFVIRTKKCGLRVHAYKTRKGYGIQIRIFPNQPIGRKAGNYPEVVESISNLRNGLVVVCGLKGSGRSSLIRAMQLERQTGSIAAIERLTEVPFRHPKTLLCQLEQGNDSTTLSEILDGATMSDFDMITAPAIMDSKFIKKCIQAAVSSLMIIEIEALNELDALNRLINILDGKSGDRHEILSKIIKAIIHVQRIKQDTGVIHPLLGIIHINQTCEDLIRSGKLSDLYKTVEKGNAGKGSQSVDLLLSDWVKQKKINLDQAMAHARSPLSLKLQTKGIIHTE